MISAVAALAVIAAAAPADDLSASQIFTKMLTKYHDATSIRGTIEMTQTAHGETATARATIRTAVQAKKPNLFFVEQTRSPKSDDPLISNHFHAACDGKAIVYTIPAHLLPMIELTAKQNRLYEEAPETIERGLDAICTLALDRDLPLGLALYNPYEIQRITNRFSGLVIHEDVTVNSKPAWRLKANFGTRYENRPTQYTPTYIYIDKDFNLLGIVREESVLDKNVVFTITTKWEVNLQVDAEVDAGLFVVR